MAPTDETTIHMIREVAIRYRGRARRAPGPINSSRILADFMRGLVFDDAREHFVAVYCDGRHRAIAHQIVSVGTATSALVHPREVFQPAVLLGAGAVAVGHNHPSDDPAPSADDRQVTARLAKAGTILGIHLLDSLVWTRSGGYTSLRDTEPELF